MLPLSPYSTLINCTVLQYTAHLYIVGIPVLEDELLCAVPVCAPYSTLINCTVLQYTVHLYIIGIPVLEDELLFAVPVCAPYSTLINYKYKGIIYLFQ